MTEPKTLSDLAATMNMSEAELRAKLVAEAPAFFRTLAKVFESLPREHEIFDDPDIKI